VLTCDLPARSINDALYKPPLITEPIPLSPSPARIRSTLATIVDQPDDLRELRLFHKALADVNRLRIVKRLSRGSATVRDLIEHVGLSQPLVSWHLGRLRAAGLVGTRRSGRETVCSLRPEAFDVQAVRERELLGLDGREADDREEPLPGATITLPAQPGTADA
jgi:ArsR family transcriptional regulator